MKTKITVDASGFLKSADRLKITTRLRVIHAVDETRQKIEEKAKENIAVDSGKTKRAIDSETVRGGMQAIVGVKKSRAHIGRWLEFGTAKTRAQPWLNPAAESERQNHIDRMKKAVR